MMTRDWPKFQYRDDDAQVTAVLCNVCKRHDHQYDILLCRPDGAAALPNVRLMVLRCRGCGSTELTLTMPRVYEAGDRRLH